MIDSGDHHYYLPWNSTSSDSSLDEGLLLSDLESDFEE